MTTKTVTYVYDTADRLISRTETNAGQAPDTTLYFYWGSSGNLAEETDTNGNLKVRYLPDEDGEPIAQEKPGLLGTNWTWLLPDTNGNVATQVDDTGTVTEQAAYDPYGKKDKGGSSKPEGQASNSSLGFQGALTDPTTGSVILGARQYDPGVGRFLTPDVFVASALDVSLGTDDLTGNRYLFAAANPVAFYEDGHWPSMPKFVKKLAKRALPALSFVPVVGTAIDVVSAATGRDWLNGGKKLSGPERALMLAGAAAGMVPGVGAAAKAGLKVAAKAAVKGRTAAKVASAVAPQTAGEVSLSLRYKRGWTGAQRAAADAKVAALNEADLVVTPVQRSGTSAAARYRRAGGEIPSAHDVDHVIDLQLGGADDILNMNPLDYSVNRSLGAQIGCRIRGLPVGTRVTGVSIC
ncbi:MAG: pre-toxin TG domain-containing protein [Actinomycetota bacterium]|nr:pre-toxin TG domain-containing protein [Actinomycetota bacterium]